MKLSVCAAAPVHDLIWAHAQAQKYSDSAESSSLS